ncbi:MAG: hypothetical protein WBG90_03735 [Saonia sp.]
MKKMKKGLFTLILLCANFLCAQKIIKKSIINPGVSLIQIEADNCFEVDVATSNTNEMVVEAVMDGEYKKNLLVNVKEEGTTVLVRPGFQPNFIKPNDKLSAHKIVSIALTIKVPQYLNLQIYGVSCNVTASGRYETLKVTLADGSCVLNNVGETVDIITQSGDIYVSSPFAEIKAWTKYGKIYRETIPGGNNLFTLNTTTGNIHLKKTE